MSGGKMQVRETVLKEIESVPKQYLGEILDFIRYLETKALDETIETAIASESSLAKDWLIREENEAWQDL